MSTLTIRKKLHQHIDDLPDDIIEQIADFTLFVVARRQIAPTYADWTPEQWQQFTLDQFFQDEDDINYSLADAQEIYHS